VPAYWLLDPAGKIVAKVYDPDELATALAATGSSDRDREAEARREPAGRRTSRAMSMMRPMKTGARWTRCARDTHRGVTSAAR
jgi:hypothetical protein